VPVSTTASPVTHTAEVDVNTAVITSALRPLSVAHGRDNRAEPIIMATAKPKTTRRAGWRTRLDPSAVSTGLRRSRPTRAHVRSTDS
jgi:hypothetical protein